MTFDISFHSYIQNIQYSLFVNLVIFGCKFVESSTPEPISFFSSDSVGTPLIEVTK